MLCLHVLYEEYLVTQEDLRMGSSENVAEVLSKQNRMGSTFIDRAAAIVWVSATLR